MVWGCFTQKRMGLLVLIEDKLNANGCNKLLAENLLPFINELKEEDVDGIFTFQEDNAPCLQHTDGKKTM